MPYKGGGGAAENSRRPDGKAELFRSSSGEAAVDLSFETDSSAFPHLNEILLRLCRRLHEAVYLWGNGGKAAKTKLINPAWPSQWPSHAAHRAAKPHL